MSLNQIGPQLVAYPAPSGGWELEFVLFHKPDSCSKPCFTWELVTSANSGPDPRPESESLGVEPRNMCFNNSSHPSYARECLRRTVLEYTCALLWLVPIVSITVA